ncbi:MAG: DUF5317 family protein [Chloroflexi bacterium]|nr:DUF5317 family protein [Chloroflexota bacterium]
MLAIVVPAIAVGLIAGWLRAGRTLPDRVPLRGANWIASSLVLQIAAVALVRPVDLSATGVLLVGSALLLLVGIGLDWSPAMAVVGLGVGLNLAAMVANGGMMPLPADALAQDIHRPAYAVGDTPQFSKARIADPADVRLGILADSIRSPGGGLLSVGDIVLAVGVGVLAWERLGRRAPGLA